MPRIVSGCISNRNGSHIIDVHWPGGHMLMAGDGSSLLGNAEVWRPGESLSLNGMIAGELGFGSGSVVFEGQELEPAWVTGTLEFGGTLVVPPLTARGECAGPSYFDCYGVINVHEENPSVSSSPPVATLILEGKGWVKAYIDTCLELLPEDRLRPIGCVGHAIYVFDPPR